MRSAIHNAFKAAAEGTLTPNEYLNAGDLLVMQCPTWQWEGGDPKKRKPYLPPDRQFLVTRGVPSTRRADELEHSATIVGVIKDGGRGGGGGGGGYIETPVTMEGAEGEEGWVATHTDPVASLARHQALATGSREVLDISGEPTLVGGGVGQGDRGEDEVPDIDEAALPPPQPSQQAASTQSQSGAGYRVAVEPTDEAALFGTSTNSAILKTRTYDLFITYDQFYCVPRLWLSGFDENRNPLSMDLILQDVSEDHARKTVTAEPHPHLAAGLSVASIHPCRHGEVMRRLVDKIQEGGGSFEIEHYMLLFLKFISSIVPTIQYDWTMTV